MLLIKRRAKPCLDDVNIKRWNDIVVTVSNGFISDLGTIVHSDGVINLGGKTRIWKFRHYGGEAM